MRYIKIKNNQNNKIHPLLFQYIVRGMMVRGGDGHGGMVEIVEAHIGDPHIAEGIVHIHYHVIRFTQVDIHHQWDQPDHVIIVVKN